LFDTVQQKQGLNEIYYNTKFPDLIKRGYNAAQTSEVRMDAMFVL